MVGTAQADNFAVFIRKIGYSVGVEAILKRASDFGRAYASSATFRESDWDALVHKEWQLRSPNISDVFNALDLAKIQNREVYPGQMGEALGILNRFVPRDDSDLATRLVVATAIVRSDGDVFLNALKSEFRESEFSDSLVRMINAKRDALFQVFSAQRDREAVSKSVTIDRQKTNRGSASGGGLTALTRSAPIGVRTSGLGLPSKVDIYKVDPPSSDYLRKVTASRKGWAETLGLYSSGGLTKAGDRFLVELTKAGFARPDGIFVVWPTVFEIVSNKFQIESFQSLGLMSTWGQQLAIYRAMGGGHGFASENLDFFVSSVTKIYEAYRHLSQHRSMIRNEVPGNVVSMVMLGEALSKGCEVLDLAKIWHDPRLDERGITIRPSKTIEFAITVRPDAH